MRMYSRTRKLSSHHSRSYIRCLYVIVLTLSTISIYEFMSLKRQSTILKSSHDQLSKSIVEHELKKKELMKKLKDALGERDSANESRNELELQLRGGKEGDKITGELEVIKNQMSIAQQQIERLKADLQNHGRHAVIEKYGEGPIRIEFKIEFHPDEIPDGTADSFIVELAPVELMPYTVNFFLEQVSRGLYNGCSFHRNAGHVIQGGPVTNHLNNGTNLRKGFKDADLGSVAFQEYHPDFPHKKYTMGFAGRPGGPDFYISTVDNTRNHGPGGQASYAVKSEADPCFAKVIEGYDAVERMKKLSVEPGSYKRMKHYVAIKSVTVLNEPIQSSM